MNKEKLYVGSELYLPYSSFNSDFIELSLTIFEGRKKTKLFRREKNHLVVPKYYLSDEELSDVECEVEYLPELKFEQVEFTHSITLRPGQVEAWNHFSVAKCGILNLAPGKGKTVLSLLKIANNKTPALIAVNTSSLLEQWKEFIEKFLGITKVGQVADGVFDWKHPITIATVQSLVSKVKREEIPEEFNNWFGQYYIDEMHHIGGAEFCLIAPLCKGQKFGLSATEKRTDGRERIIKYMIGDIIYSNKEYDLKPVIKIIHIDKCETKFVGHSESVISSLSLNKASNLEKAKWIKKLSLGRKCIAVSTRKEQLKEMSALFPNSVAITAEIPKERRLPLVREKQISFIIDQFGTEALDCPELDTLFMLLPIPADKKEKADGTTELLGNNIQQLMGRILRTCEGKQEPLVVIFDDINVSEAHSQIESLKRWMESNGYSYRIETS